MLVASTMDAKFRAFGTVDGRLLWEHALPFAGDAYVAFALPAAR